MMQRLWTRFVRAMSQRMRRIVQTLADEKGASTAEYALILTLIVVILITTLSELGATLNSKLSDIITQIEGAR